MKLSVVSPHVPEREGTAAGKVLMAWCEGARSLGHEVELWCWDRPVYPPKGEIPPWCRYEPFETVTGAMWREHARSVLRPRWGLARAGWEPADGAVAVADDPSSYPAVAHLDSPVVTFYCRSAADALAVRQPRPSTVQLERSERRASRGASLSLVYSPRVGRALPGRKRYVPVAYPVPAAALEPVDEPVAMMMADWLWPPNRFALARLMKAWPEVRASVPAAQLLLAGRNLPRGLGELAGVKALGEVASSVDVLSQASVLAFPCPNSSGPKVKVLEALSHGLPVVTTPAGVEGLRLGSGDGAVVGELGDFAANLAALLKDPEQRAALGKAGRAAIEVGHSPLVSARALLDAISEVGPGAPGNRWLPGLSSRRGSAGG
ncbi:MAG: glycosyltransferase family 4 protein [Acidimicrobiales bacterium]